MSIEFITRADNTDVYAVYSRDGSPVGTVEEVLTGPNRGCYAYSLLKSYTREQIMRAFQNRRTA